LAFLALAALIAIVSAEGDAFAHADANQDGRLDRAEFKQWQNKVEHALEPLLDHQDKEHHDVAPVGGDLLGGLDLPIVYQGGDFVTATINSLLVILLTELGDKTFFIAAVLAMKNGRAIVYAGAMGALALMHILSCIMGVALPSLLPRAYTHFASAVLFLYFGCRLLKDAYEMVGEGPSEELQEVEEELINKKDGSATEEDRCDDVEDGEKGKAKKGSSVLKSDNLKVLTQAFTLTFLAEWGDRSQIATVALAAQKNVFGVALGGLIGHAFCTGLAVIGTSRNLPVARRTLGFTHSLSNSHTLPPIPSTHHSQAGVCSQRAYRRRPSLTAGVFSFSFLESTHSSWARELSAS